ncbi:uncharacterized protein EAF01_009959 [Botrytis porri]|uniref:Uncharacterized protein n=1 Tax=Botrytis porri TaxID=87229 RepID=A0A4Z1KQU9_9HELO|nr:uncharacterized protein EAF01_009959 [Botrytis porri]KAF7894508.1 hypothetical protein EAF01_009959 [Botrytis porri]TGO87172.1 hypothetical protein BPOR_0245g00100 [Botrytis porri]
MISENNSLCETPEDQVAGSIPIDKNEEENIIERFTKTDLDLVSLFSPIDQGAPTAIVEMLVQPINGVKSPKTRFHDLLNSTRES